MFKTLIYSLVFFSQVSFAVTCPVLQGSYLCPGNNGNPDFLLRITEELNDDYTEAHYIYQYPDLGIPDIDVYASSKGKLNEGEKPYWAACYEDTMIYFNDADSSGFFQMTHLNEDGDLEVFVRGKQVIVCERECR